MINDYLTGIGNLFEDIGVSCSILVGGSYSYKYDGIHDLSELRDIDLLIIVENKQHTIRLLKKFQDDIVRILKISKPETIFSDLDLAPLADGDADCVRFSGINYLNQKVSVKIADFEFLQRTYLDQNSSRINVLSKKDKRFYRKKAFDGQNLYIGVVNQKTNTNLTILGDPDIFKIENSFSLGVISDLLLTGKVIQNIENIDIYDLQAKLIKKVFKLASVNSTCLDWPKLLIRNERFSDKYKVDSKNYLNSLGIEISVENGLPQKINDYEIGIVDPIIRKKLKHFYPPKYVPPDEIVSLNPVKTSGPFSSNSIYGMITLRNDDKKFYKEMRDEHRFQAEINGLVSISPYFNHLQIPSVAIPEKNIIVYDWNPGIILARKRLGNCDEDKQTYFMELELRKCEDHLNAYLFSSFDVYRKKIHESEMYFSRINDLFYKRLAGNRFNDFYSDYYFEIDSKRTTILNILDLNVVINGVEYGSISQIYNQAKINLNPRSLAKKQIVCGLGDCHSGNIMVEENVNQYTYIDYEFAGFHSPYLDIAKAIYNDCAFNVFYSDELNIHKDIRLKIRDNNLEIEHDYISDALTRFILKSKQEGILTPFIQSLKNNNMPVDEDWQSILGSALFCCGFLTRKPTDFGSKSNFFLNLANCIEMTRYEKYYKKTIS